MVLGIAGPKGTGKDTSAKIVSQVYGLNIRSFGYAVKKELCELINNSSLTKFKAFLRDYSSPEQASRFLTIYNIWHGQIKIEDFNNRIYKDVWFRELMQWWGTDVRRAQDPKYWINELAWEEDIIIPDVRFENEILDINLRGGKTIYLSKDFTYVIDKLHISEALNPESCDSIIHWPHGDIDTCIRNLKYTLIYELGFPEKEWLINSKDFYGN